MKSNLNGSGSSIKGISLGAFLQFLQNEQKTCTLEISADGRQGVIFCVDGKIIDAQIGAAVGKAALYAILACRRPGITVTDGCMPRERRIDAPLMHLLMEACRSVDESGRKKAQGQDIAYQRLERRLTGRSEIKQFEILDAGGRVLSTPARGSGPPLAPQEFLRLAEAAGKIIGDRIKSVSVGCADRTRYFMAKSDRYFVRAALKPGAKSVDIL